MFNSTHLDKMLIFLLCYFQSKLCDYLQYFEVFACFKLLAYCLASYKATTTTDEPSLA